MASVKPNVFKVNTKDTKTTSIEVDVVQVSLLLILSRFGTMECYITFWCLYCELWASLLCYSRISLIFWSSWLTRIKLTFVTLKLKLSIYVYEAPKATKPSLTSTHGKEANN